MIFLHPRFKSSYYSIDSLENGKSAAMATAELILSGAKPDEVHVDSGTRFNFNCVPIRGIMLF